MEIMKRIGIVALLACVLGVGFSHVNLPIVGQAPPLHSVISRKTLVPTVPFTNICVAVTNLGKMVSVEKLARLEVGHMSGRATVSIEPQTMGARIETCHHACPCRSADGTD